MKNPVHAKTVKSADGTTIYYEITKHTSNPTLLFLHGIGGDMRVWDPQRDKLTKKGYTVVTIDLRGHGLSDRPTGKNAYDMARYGEDIQAVLIKEHVKNPILVGHSFGGMIAITFVGNHPKACKALILIDAHYKPTSYGKLLASTPGLSTMLTFLATYSPTIHIEKRADYKKFIGTGEYNPIRLTSDLLHTSLKSYLASWDQALTYNASRLLKNIRLPVLIIAGEKDTVFPPKSERQLARRINASEIDFIPDGTHITVLNNSRDITRDILHFLKQKQLL